ncbi:glutathione S-transferase [Pontivivens insulae]|uniref:Putative GST-like protein YibF n=1 Tax=Pontivivens insulae TaxID=1639689 RepID=A0A2R8AB43_9RHOB|nr:glutathione S-transferase [Pontivivens insulae]RED13186.1 glutathione S-transferase [Pontivivens insulae]SPF29278.1 putative GST-like protein YibF [Pontivivens insulae]
MKLYDSTTSPYCRKVNILIEEADKADAVELAYVKGTPMNPGTLPVGSNPLGKIPCLVRETGPALFDSRVICAYLDAEWQLELYPEGARGWDVRTLEALSDGILDASILIVYEGRTRPEDKQFDGWIDAQRAKVERALDALEALWLSHLAGPFDMGHIAVAAAVGYIDFRGVVPGWRDSRPGLAAWAAEIAERPSIAATVPHE